MKNYLVIIFLISILFLGCNPLKNQKPPEIPDNEKNTFIPAHIRNEIIIWYKDLEAKKEHSERIVANFQKLNPKMTITRESCSKCLDLTEKLTGAGLDALLEMVLDGHGDLIRSSDRKTSGATGDTSVVVSLNFLTSVFDSDSSSMHKISGIDVKHFSGKEVPVAVVDSGIDQENFPLQFLFTDFGMDECYPNGKYGYGFVDPSGDITDSTTSKHGTLVNYYILEQFLKEKVNIPRLLNVKALNRNNSGSVFGLLCSLYYAKEKGAKIINTSMGFYDNDKYFDMTDGKNPILFMMYKEHLLPNGIILVTASGNKDVSQVPSELVSQRDLTQNRFYPAVLSETDNGMPNSIITATTVNRSSNEPSQRQNYSSRHVDVGVVADKEVGEWYSFYLPFTQIGDQNRPSVSGSSFANAILTGKISAKFNPSNYLIVAKSPKSEWLDAILNPDIQSNSTDLIPYIHKGKNFRRIDE
ncbi:S8/S53 family peptidase [Cognataquiflexum rubidum]|uniref:S8/S53 family peptidase n=1 Tax=Cognataquiflexum rubidum TaxID=2922273 RepID=UPI001F13D2D4|nr:S8/S53 family peptidase [Cognataquiflexum rubidum]MCH6234208.1 S8/S53 family peptidase [Cognataquiflexum rubidum]